MLVVNGPVFNGTGHTTAVDGSCPTCSGVKLRNVQINGTRSGAPPTGGGANIEFGGANTNQLIEYVRSFDPRSWSCLHVAEGGLQCNNATVQNNDIGPCGSDAFQEWADGISMSCNNSLVQNNMINNPTDGGIVLFGAPGTLVQNNTIWVETVSYYVVVLSQLVLKRNSKHFWVGSTWWTMIHTMETSQVPLCRTTPSLVDSLPTPLKGRRPRAQTLPMPLSSKPRFILSIFSISNIVFRIGIAIGPRTWFGDNYLQNVSTSGTVLNNRLSGAFSYAIAMSSATNFTVTGNTLFGNTSFIGAIGPNCTVGETIPQPKAFVVDLNNTLQSTYQFDFETIADGDGLTCVLPPEGGSFWPFGGHPDDEPAPPSIPAPRPTSTSTPTPSPSSQRNTGLTAGAKAGIAIGVILGVMLLALTGWFLRRWVMQRRVARRAYPSQRYNIRRF